MLFWTVPHGIGPMKGTASYYIWSWQYFDFDHYKIKTWLGTVKLAIILKVHNNVVLKSAIVSFLGWNFLRNLRNVSQKKVNSWIFFASLLAIRRLSVCHDYVHILNRAVITVPISILNPEFNQINQIKSLTLVVDCSKPLLTC